MCHLQKTALWKILYIPPGTKKKHESTTKPSTYGTAHDGTSYDKSKDLSQMTCHLLCSNLYTIQGLLQYVQCTAVYTLWYNFCNSLSLIPSTTAPGARDNSMLGQRPGNEVTFVHTCVPSMTWPGPGRPGSARQGRLVRTTVAEDSETLGLYQHHSLQEQWWYYLR